MQALALAIGEIQFDIFLFDEAHHGSIRSVACLNGARLEQSLNG
jgi:hypothetical protein